MPPLPQRTNSMPMSVTPANISASWPAPLGEIERLDAGSRDGLRQCRLHRAARRAPRAWRADSLDRRGHARGAGRSRRWRRGFRRSPHRASRHRSTRTSSDNSQRAGNDVDQSVRHRDLADRADQLRSTAEQRRSTASTISAAAAAASWRSAIGTVPACPATPSIVMRNRADPAIEVTTPTGRSLLQQHRSLLDMNLEIAAKCSPDARQPLDCR